MVLRPVQKGQLKLGHPRQQLGVLVSGNPQLLSHIGADRLNPAVSGVGLVGDQQVQLRILLHLNTQFIQTLDGRVAGKEVLGPGTKGDDLQVFHTDDGPGNGNKLPDHLCTLLGCAHGIFGDVGLETAQPQIIRAVQHAAVGVAPAIDQVSIPFRSSHIHYRAMESLGQDGLRGLRAEVAQVHHQGIAPGGPHILQSLQGIRLVFHSDGTVVQPRAIRLDHGLPAGGGQGNGEAVPGDGNDAKLHFWYILKFHRYIPHFLKTGLRARFFWEVVKAVAPQARMDS